MGEILIYIPKNKDLVYVDFVLTNGRGAQVITAGPGFYLKNGQFKGHEDAGLMEAIGRYINLGEFTAIHFDKRVIAMLQNR